ncbi:MAG: dephospho-CoA kinase, partial [Clostridiales bacterium]|nr:dephospho-CoA kinase [Clostridiales bacterium]
MKIIGLTGGIATGKSQVSSMLSELGAIIIDADIVAREVVQKGLPAWQQIKDEFGQEYLLSNGELNRKKLGKLVFTNPDALAKLNSITHPAIKGRIEDRINNLKAQDFKGVVVVDAALLLETGWETMVDQVWVVDAPMEKRIERLMIRDNFTRDQALSRINSQMSQQERIAKADKIIYNNSDIDSLREQVQRIWNETLKE